MCSPSLVAPFLRALDTEAAEVGATRGLGPDVKSVARLVGPEAVVNAVDEEWATDYVRSSCIVLPPNAPTEV